MRIDHLLGQAAAAAAISLAAAVAAGQPARLVLDGSLGPEGPIAPNAANEYHVTDDHGVFSAGGENRFHSFSQFNLLSPSESAVFSSMASPQRVIVRVTQPGVFVGSLINGTLKSTIPGADLYLLNPHGIQFDGGAAIDVQGSFYASTAGFLRFEDGVDLPTGEAITPQTLSVAQPEAFGFTGAAPGGIDVSTTDGLLVPEGQVLSFTAGRFDLSRSTIRAPGATVQIGVASGATDLPVDLSGLDPAALPPPPGDALGSGAIQVRNDAAVDVSSPVGGGAPAGRIVIRGGHFALERSRLGAVHREPGVDAAGPYGVDVDVNGAVEIDHSVILTATESDGAGGGVRLAGPLVAVHGSQVASEVTDAGSGAGGTVEIVAETLRVSNTASSAEGSFVATFTESPAATGTGGELDVRADTLELVAGGQLLAQTDGAAAAGALSVIDADFAHLDGVDGAGRPSGIVGRALENAAGAGGDLEITTRKLQVDNGAQISAATFGSGDAGNLSITATESVGIRGGPEGATIVSAASVAPMAGSQLGQSGDLTIRAPQLVLADGGQVTVNTEGTLPAGDLEIRSDDVSISGVDPAFGTNPAGVFAQALSPGSDGGDGGNIAIVATGDIDVSDRGRVSVLTEGGGSAGAISLRAGGRIRIASSAGISAVTFGTGDGGSISLDASNGVAIVDGGEISARSMGSVNPGDAGDIVVDAGPRLDLVRASIDTEASGASGGRIDITARNAVVLQDARITTSVLDGNGGGGDVTIDPQFVLLDRSAIVAQAAAGPGGNIRISAGTFLASPDSLVDASSQLGIDGNVSIDSPNPELTGKLSTLPQGYLSASELLGDACLARTATEGSFVVRGLAAARPDPGEPLPLEIEESCDPASEAP